MTFLTVEVETTMDIDCFLLFPVLLDLLNVFLLPLFLKLLLKLLNIMDVIIEDLEHKFEATECQSEEEKKHPVA